MPRESNPMYLRAELLQEYLSWEPLIESLQRMFQSHCAMPSRHHHAIPVPEGDEAALLVMPAWIEGEYLGVKLASVFPGNRVCGLDTIFANYLLNNGATGELLAIMEGGELTARRTAAASVLAAKYLAPKQARHHLMVGTGRLSTYVIEAYASAFDIERVSVWGRNRDRSQQIAAKLKSLGILACAVAVDDLDKAVAEADIISCATSSRQPLIKGALLNPGTHIDLIGSFTPVMREADDEVMCRGKLFVDTREGALKESGDLLIPIQRGVLSRHDIYADLYDLCRNQHIGRQCDDDITVFKSVGAACEDLAAAVLAYQKHIAQP